MNIRAEINKTETRKGNRIDQQKRSIKLKAFFFENVNKIDKPLARLTRKMTQIYKIINERGDITTDIEIQEV